jgi:hypothetical protein
VAHDLELLTHNCLIAANMHSRAARLILLALFLLATGVAAFLFWKGESLADSEAIASRKFDALARSVSRALFDLRAAQQAYVAVGQGNEFWTTKAAQELLSTRSKIKALHAEASSPQARSAIEGVSAALDDFVRIDKRAVEHVRSGQRLLASDVIFADGLELTEAALTALEHARAAEAQSRDGSVEMFRRRQAFAVAAGGAAAVLAVLLLVPRPEPQQVPVPVVERTVPRAARRPELLIREGETGVWSTPQRVATALPPVDAPAEVHAAEPASSPVPSAPLALPASSPDFINLASLCVDLARVVDTRALPSLLDRAADALDASGIVLWIADPDGRELNPIFAQGYPPQLVNRLGTIPRDAENATAAAFRTSLLQTVKTDAISEGAIAAPLVTPAGCVGVMAAEVRHEAEAQDLTLAAATIVAAQLATLVGPPSARNQTKTGAAGA